MIDVDLRTFMIQTLGSLWAEPYMIQQGFADQQAPPERIWFRRSSYSNETLLSGPNTIANTEFDIEIYSPSQADALDIADRLKEALNGYAGAFGDSTALLCEIEDHDDDYTLQGFSGDTVFFFATLSLSVIHLI